MKTLDLLKHPVLVVDDEPHILAAIQEALQPECTVLTAQNAEEALEMLKREHVSVIISDQRMTGMSGTEFLGVVSQQYPTIGRIMLTAYDDKKDLFSAIDTGKVSAYLMKPVEKHDLLLVVKREIALCALRYEHALIEHELKSFKGMVVECEQQVFHVSDRKGWFLDEITIPVPEEADFSAIKKFTDELYDMCLQYYFLCPLNQRPDITRSIEWVYTYSYCGQITSAYIKEFLLRALKKGPFVIDPEGSVLKIYEELKGKTIYRRDFSQSMAPYFKDPSQLSFLDIAFFAYKRGYAAAQLFFYTDYCIGIIQNQGGSLAYGIYPRPYKDFLILPFEKIAQCSHITGVQVCPNKYTWYADDGRETNPRSFIESFFAAMNAESERIRQYKPYQLYTVLVVDDEEPVLHALSDILNQHFTVMTAKNPVDALALLEKHEVSIVLSDQLMPHMKGTEFLEKVRMRYPLVRRLILSAYDDKQNVLPAINNALISGYLVKPGDPHTLRTVLSKEMDIFFLEKQLVLLHQAVEQVRGAAVYLQPAVSYNRAVIHVVDADNSTFEAGRAFSGYTFDLLTEKYFCSSAKPEDRELIKGLHMAYTLYDAVLHRNYVADKIRKALMPKDFERYHYVAEDGFSIMIEHIVEENWQKMINAHTDAYALVKTIAGRDVTIVDLEHMLKEKGADPGEINACMRRLTGHRSGRSMGEFIIYNDYKQACIQHQPGKIVYTIEPREPLPYVLFTNQVLARGRTISGKTVGSYKYTWEYTDTHESVTPESLLLDIFQRLREEK